MVAIAIILIGPGRYGFDAGRGWARRPFIGSFVVLLLGIAALTGAKPASIGDLPPPPSHVVDDAPLPGLENAPAPLR